MPQNVLHRKRGIKLRAAEFPDNSTGAFSINPGLRRNRERPDLNRNQSLGQISGIRETFPLRTVIVFCDFIVYHQMARRQRNVYVWDDNDVDGFSVVDIL